jgi:hypothetical protein
MSFAAHLERVARRIGINVLAIELHRTQRQHPRSRGSGIFHHDVQVKLLLHCTALHCTALHCTALHCTASGQVLGRLPGARWNARPEDISLAATTSQSSSR